MFGICVTVIAYTDRKRQLTLLRLWLSTPVIFSCNSDKRVVVVQRACKITVINSTATFTAKIVLLTICDSFSARDYSCKCQTFFFLVYDEIITAGKVIFTLNAFLFITAINSDFIYIFFLGGGGIATLLSV